MFFNNNENQFLTLTFDLQNHVRLRYSENYLTVSVITVKKTLFNLVPILLLHSNLV